MTYHLGEEVEVLSTGEVSSIEKVTKNFLYQTRYKIIGNSKKFKENELRKHIRHSTSSITDSSGTDAITQIVMANVYMDHMESIINDVSDYNQSSETKSNDNYSSPKWINSSDDSSSSSTDSSSSSYDSGSSSSSSSSDW